MKDIRQNELDWHKTYSYSFSNAQNGDSSIINIPTMYSINWKIGSCMLGAYLDLTVVHLQWSSSLASTEVQFLTIEYEGWSSQWGCFMSSRISLGDMLFICIYLITAPFSDFSISLIAYNLLTTKPFQSLTLFAHATNWLLLIKTVVQIYHLGYTLCKPIQPATEDTKPVAKSRAI